MERLILCLLGVALAAVPPASDNAKRENQASLAASAKGDYPAARRHAAQALSLARADKDLRSQSQAFNNLATADIYSGEYATAEQLLRKALNLSGSAALPDLEAEQLTNLGGIYFYQGRYDEAFAAYSRAGEIAARHPGQEWVKRRLRLIRTNRAALHQRLGQNEAALALYRSMLAETEVLGSAERAQLLSNLGVCYRRLGDPVKALETYDKAQSLFAAARSLDGELGVGKNRGIVLALDLGELDQARKVFLDNRQRAAAAGNRREELQAILYAAECALRGNLPEAGSEFASASALASEIGAKEEEWKALYGQGRAAARSGDAMAAMGHFSRSVAVIESLRSTVGVEARADFFAGKSAVYDAIVDLRFDAASPAELFDWMERGRARAFQDRLGVARPGLESLQSGLDGRTAVLIYWRSRVKGGLVWITRSASGKRRFALEPEVVSGYRQALQQPGSAWQSVSRQLGAALLTGVEPAARIVVSPAGDLAGVPFETLEISGKPLIEAAEVSYAPTASVLVRPRQSTSWTMPWRREFSGYGDPRTSGADAALPSLPSAGRELRHAAAALGGKHSLHLGPDNRRDAFVRDDSREAPVLHLATHAIADPVFPERSRLVFSHGESVFLRQLGALDMRGTQLAVLSACDTETGRPVEGEGAQTFGRALLANGVRSAITSLWRVDDAASAQLMDVFYSALGRGESMSSALRKAKLEMRNGGGERSHPALWAGFVLNGEGSPLAPVPLPWWPFVSVAAGFAAVLVVLMARRWREATSMDEPSPQPAQPVL